MLSADLLTTLMPRLAHADVWLAALQKTCAAFAITTTSRLAMFLAQVLFESSFLTATEENLNYSADALHSVFPRYFTAAEATAYAHQPIRIANRVYANRYGNGNEASGDGWTYRGRGLIQITFKANYQNAAGVLNLSLAALPPYMTTPEGAAMSAGWFWSSHGCNALADQGAFSPVTVRINGGLNGLADRQAIWTRVRGLLSAA